MFVPTGKSRETACSCGSMAREVEGLATGEEDTYWRRCNHLAPCGLPCISGGIPGPAYRSGQYHKQNALGTWCPTCNPGVPFPKETLGPRKLAERIRVDEE